MRLIRNQFLETNNIDTLFSYSVLVIVVGDDIQNALRSLKRQIYVNFRVVCIRQKNRNGDPSGEISLFETEDADIRRQIASIIHQSDEDYTFLMAGEDSLFAHSLLEFIRLLEEHKYDLAYANECRGDADSKVIYDYEWKPAFDCIAAFQSLYSGRAVIFQREMLCRVIDQAESMHLDTLLRELFLLCIADGCKVGQIPLVLLLKRTMLRDEEAEKKLLPLLQKNITKYTRWTGRVTKTNAYYPFAFQMADCKEPCSVEFLVIEEELCRTRQLLSQIGVSYRNKKVLVAAKKEHMELLSDFCASLEMIHVMFIEQKQNYTESLQCLVDKRSCDVQIILNDQVQWINRMNIERLMLVFHKPEVKVACPQVATEGKAPQLVYAGGECNSLALTSSFLKGREQRCIPAYDLAWTSHKVVNLTPYCIAVRNETWKQIFPLHPSVCEAWQFAVELSFLCKKREITCEYAAQSAVWVNAEAGNRYIEKNGKVEIDPDLKKMHCQGSYWHWLDAYKDVIAEQAEKMRYVQRSYHRHLQENFKVYGLEHVKVNGHKRALVFSHELSLTGAPLVLVQAVESLKRMNYDVLVVSPVDGPLRDTYLRDQVPVIIEPELFSDFEYIKIVYDFDFVIACTVCLWQVIKVLGQTDIPVLWWVHDSRMGYVDYLRYVLPEKIGENIHLYCGGSYAQKVILEYRPQYTSKILLYGLQDFSNQMGNGRKREIWGLAEDKIVFANIGQIISRKGQNVLIEAIEKLPDKLLRESVFVFVGSVVDRSIYHQIINLQKQYPDNIRYIKQIDHNDLKEFYRETDCLICSSVDDPMPAFIAEGLMMARVCICSDHTAFYGLIEEGKNGFLFESGNAQMLSQKIAYVIKEKEQLAMIKKNARKLYEDTFTREKFEHNFKQVIKELTN